MHFWSANTGGGGKLLLGSGVRAKPLLGSVYTIHCQGKVRLGQVRLGLNRKVSILKS